MDKKTIEKLHELENLERNAKNIICNSQPNADSIRYLFNFDENFKKDLYTLRNKYYDLYSRENSSIMKYYYEVKYLETTQDDFADW